MPNVLEGEQRPGESTIKSKGGIPVLEETFYFLVKTDDVNASRLSVLATPGLPQPGISLSSFGNAVCSGITATRRENQLDYWDVVAQFSSEVEENQTGGGGGGGGGQDPRTDPEEWLPVYETKFERTQEQATEDQLGVAIANSAGQPFENGILRGRFIPIWDFFQFESRFVDDADVIERNETINDVPFKGKAEKTLLCTVVASRIGWYYGARRRLTHYQLRYNEKTWLHKRLDVGTVYLQNGVHEPYLDKKDNVMLGGLDGTGARVAPGAKPAILEFDMYKTNNFAFLR